jgi:hypothetical protein
MILNSICSFLRDFDNDMQCQNCRVVLLIDNVPSHRDTNNNGNPILLTNIKLVCLHPNMTAHTQPMDRGIIASFKSNFQTLKIQCALCIFTHHLNQQEEEQEMRKTGLAKDKKKEATKKLTDSNIQLPTLYKINDFEAMTIASAAWEKVTPETIANCWKHVKILPGTENEEAPTKPYANPKSLDRLKDSLDDLAEIAICPIGIPTIDELINVPGEEITEVALTINNIIKTVEHNAAPAEDLE